MVVHLRLADFVPAFRSPSKSGAIFLSSTLCGTLLESLQDDFRKVRFLNF